MAVMAEPQRVNIAAHLPAVAARQPDALAVVIQGKRRDDGTFAYEEWSARRLDAESNRVANGLVAAGIVRGMRTVLMVPPSAEFFVLTFALLKVGAIPVVVDPGMGVRRLKACLGQAAPEAFIGITKAHVARVVLGWARKTVQKRVTVGPRLFWGGNSYAKLLAQSAEFAPADTAADEVAAILFTSGSTGTPKGAVYTHRNFAAQVAALREHYGIAPGERDLATFPLFALFGPALGMAAVVPNMDASRPITADPERLLAAARDYECTNLFASPALLGKLGRYGAEHGEKLPKLRRVISAGAPTSAQVLQQFQSLLPEGVEIFPSYGATEALPIAAIGSREFLSDAAAATAEGAGVCVGRPVGASEIRMIRISDEVIPEWTDDLEVSTGTIGEICVKGPVVTREYFQLPEATARAKISDPAGGFYHRMGDVGYVDDKGRLWFCGRKSHRIETPAGTVFTIPCERIFDAHPEVPRSAVVGVTRDGVTRAVLCVEGDGIPHARRQTLRAELLALAKDHPQTAAVEEILFTPPFPVDVRHNAKIFRERLAEYAAKRI